MRIDRITLCNFGSYEGNTSFDTKVKDERNIIIIGGKNGAGKTTLFTAIRLCLYGYMSMGYKNNNSFYFKTITKLINNAAKLKRPVNSYVELELSLSNGQSLDHYVLTRSWKLDESISESFNVLKNGIELSSEEVNDFEKFILSLIPPELFNLYFFDGEKIADFFLDEGSNARIKNAFLTLCGYDTFEIMRKNFKRIGSSGSTQSSLTEYIEAKEDFERIQEEYSIKEDDIVDCKTRIDNCHADLESLESDYRKHGGSTQEEWNKKLEQLKEEEKKREGLNQLLKKWANDIIPFIMVKSLLQQVKDQIGVESDSLKYRHFVEVLTEKDISSTIDNNLLNELVAIANEKHEKLPSEILKLSFEQSATLLYQINTLLDFETNKIFECKKLIKSSINKSAKIRSELEKSNVNSVQQYLKDKAELHEKNSRLMESLVSLEKELAELAEQKNLLEAQYKKAQSVLENELKAASINDISAKAILMLDNLQSILYHKQIQKVEKFFRKEISTLMRKTHFIDDIKIDDDFNIHIYREETIPITKIEELVKSNNEDQLISLMGIDAVSKIKETVNIESLKRAIEEIKNIGMKEILLPIEIDKTSLSNGEKQILIMAIYHSLVQLCNHEIPFVIDTPFARIDTEHRNNISKHFFSKLNGQVFILSTNEEINSSHVQIMKEKILATFMLENTDNTRTTVVLDKYF